MGRGCGLLWERRGLRGGAPSLAPPYRRLAWELALGTKVEKGRGPVPELVGAGGGGWLVGWGGGKGGAVSPRVRW